MSKRQLNAMTMPKLKVYMYQTKQKTGKHQRSITSVESEHQQKFLAGTWQSRKGEMCNGTLYKLLALAAK